MKPPFNVVKHKAAFLALAGDYVLALRLQEKSTNHRYMIVFQNQRKYYK